MPSSIEKQMAHLKQSCPQSKLYNLRGEESGLSANNTLIVSIYIVTVLQPQSFLILNIMTIISRTIQPKRPPIKTIQPESRVDFRSSASITLRVAIYIHVVTVLQPQSILILNSMSIIYITIKQSCPESKLYNNLKGEWTSDLVLILN